jgi:hypothetical protein
MIEILYFKKGANIIKLNVALTNLSFYGNLMCHCGRDKNKEENHMTGYTKVTIGMPLSSTC